MTGIELISAERQRQIEKEGWTPKHDDSHTSGELALMGAAFALSTYTFARLESSVVGEVGAYFGDDDWFKVKAGDDPIRNLAKAGALIAAEIDRIERMRPESV